MTQSGLVTTAGAQVPLLGVEVAGEVLAGHARVAVRQRYRNDEARPVEAVYVFPLPADATLVGFTMTANGRTLAGVVKEREAAFRAYDDAVAAGHGAALLEQERKNVFTASVGNLLPGEETLIEVVYVQRVHADQGALRWTIPTLVAPRYIPGLPAGDRTGHGVADPTTVVPDADRITPQVALGPVAYGLRLDLVFDLDAQLEIESPSHAVVARTDDKKRVHVTFAQREVALDRDVVVTARGVKAGPLVTIAADRTDGVLALTVVPDLAGGAAAPARQDVGFLIDVSGSMDGASITEARAALRLCLRHLREGDRFNITAFQSTFHSFQPAPVPFNQAMLDAADDWVAGLRAAGGTELLPPISAALGQFPDGIIILLTDGQVGNEEQILREALALRKQARIYSFGIGTNVSDQLLRDLAARTGGALELIHPGERIDEKVVAQFARALAPRVADLKLSFGAADVSEWAPAELPPLIDGEPWTLYARVPADARGTAELRGSLDGQPFYLAAPFDLRATEPRPGLIKLWAAERIRELEAHELDGRRGERMKERITQLAVSHGVASKYTSFVVVEERTGDRRASGQPETRAIPVNAPAGWAMFGTGTVKGEASKKRKQDLSGMTMNRPSAPPPPPMTMARATMMGGAPGAQAPKSAVAAPQPMAAAPAASIDGRVSGGYGRPDADSLAQGLLGERFMLRDAAVPKTPRDPIADCLGEQLASGLWDAPGRRGGDDARLIQASARALLTLLDAGVTASHALHGAQIKKAITALLALAARTPALAELALGVAALVATGKRTRDEIAALATKLGVTLGERKRVEALLTR